MPGMCSWCGHVCYGGWHDAQGRFVVESVEVTEAEIMLAHFRANRGQGRGSYARTKRNIAFGKHTGVYNPALWSDPPMVAQRGPAPYLTVGAFA